MASNRRSISIRINGKQIENTAGAIRKEFRKMNREIDLLTKGTDAYNKKASEIARVNKLLSDHKERLRGTRSAYTKLSAGLAPFVGVAASAFALDSILSYSGELFELGTEMEALGKKADTVLAEELGKVNAQAEKNANIMGLTKGQYVDNTAAIADLLIPMKFSREESAGMATNLVNLSGALSEWSAGQHSAVQVSKILSKAILGEREQLKELGISISEADVKARLAEKGLENLTGELLQQAKAAATLELITEKSADAQAAFANNSDTLVRKQAELTARFQEVKEQMATALIPVFHRILNATLGFTEGFVDATAVIEKFLSPIKGAVSAVDDQAAKVQNLESELIPLIERYEELTAITNPSTEEQKELSDVIQRIGEITPTAITQIDEYGRVLSINTDASKEFLEAEKARLKFVNQESIKTLETQIGKLQSLANIQKRLAETGETGGIISVKISPQQIDKARKEFAKLNEEIRGAQAELDRLNGDNLESNTPGSGRSDIDSNSGNGNNRTKSFGPSSGGVDLKELEKAQDAVEKLKMRVGELRQAFNTSLLGEDEQSIEAIEQRYQKELDKALELSQSNNAQVAQRAKEQILELEQLKAEEITAERERQFQKQLDEDIKQAEKLLEQEKKYQEDKNAAQQEIKAVVDESTLNERELELEALRVHHEKLLQLAEQYGLDSSQLIRIYRQEQAEINRQFDDKDLAQKREKIAKEAQLLSKGFGSLASITSGFQKLAEADGKRAARLSKTLSLITIAAKTGEAIASGVAQAVKAGPFPANLGFIASTVATVLANIATARSIVNDAPAIPQKKRGSFFNVKGRDDSRVYNAEYIGRPGTGMLPAHPVVLASEGGREYFVSNQMLKNPQVLNYVRAIENIRTARSVRQFNEGGFSQRENAQRNPINNAEQLQQLDPRVVSLLERLEQRLDQPLYAFLEDLTLIEIQERTRILNDSSGNAI